MQLDRYYASFDFARIGELAFDLTGGGDGNGDTYTVRMTTGQYYPGDIDDATITDFVTAFQTALNAARIGGGAWAVAYDNSTHIYTVTDSVAAFTATLNTVAQNALGMAAALSGLAAQPSTVRPYYIIVPAIDGIGRSSGDFNPDEGIVAAVTTMDGSQFGVGPTTRPVHHDWEQQFETHAATATDFLVAGVPWTYQHLFEHVGVWETIVAVTGTAAGVTYAANARMRLKVRPDGAAFHPSRHEADVDTHWTIPFGVVVEARPVP